MNCASDLRSNRQTDSVTDSPQMADAPGFAVEARFYRKLKNCKVRCELCPHGCTVGEGRRGLCGVRENREGVFYTLVHSRVSALNPDPIEKKPIFHFLPGTRALSVGTAGCNVHCKFCQNEEMAQSRPEAIHSEYLSPENIAQLAKRLSCPTIAYTYNEPTIFSEFAMDTADAAREAGIRSVAVSNGYMQTEALRTVYGKMDAVKIDLKAFSDSFYRKIVGGRLKPVLETLVNLRGMGKWLEIVYLVVPTLNDSDAEFSDLARWVRSNLGVDLPLHFTQFHPDYRLLNLPVTPVPTLERAKAIADAEGLHYVYIGNVPGHPAQDTFCPNCRALLVKRVGFAAVQVSIREGNCPSCQHPIPGIWQLWE